MRGSLNADGITLFVNSIATQRLSADDELALQERYGDLLKRVVIEITESEYSREMALYKEALAHRFGARLAIDDFGSGYNGETSLLDYRADFVKIDMGIVRDIDAVKDHQDIAKSLISYAHDRGITRGRRRRARRRRSCEACVELGADYVQGYLAGQATAPHPQRRARRHQAAHSLDRRRRAVVTLVETLHIEAASVHDERAEAVMPVTPDVLQPLGLRARRRRPSRFWRRWPAWAPSRAPTWRSERPFGVDVQVRHRKGGRVRYRCWGVADLDRDGVSAADGRPSGSSGAWRPTTTRATSCRRASW